MSGGHPSRRERKKLETRQSLMDSALRLFDERGYDATTVKDITDSAGVAKGTFFNYFDTKEAILPAIAGDRLEELNGALNPREGDPSSPIARIKVALCLVAEHPLCKEELAHQLFAAMMTRREVGPGHTLRDLLVRLVEQAQDCGEIRRDLDALYLAGVIRALFFQRLALCHYGNRPGALPELIDASIDVLLAGAGGPAWRAPERRDVDRGMGS